MILTKQFLLNYFLFFFWLFLLVTIFIRIPKKVKVLIFTLYTFHFLLGVGGRFGFHFFDVVIILMIIIKTIIVLHVKNKIIKTILCVLIILETVIAVSTINTCFTRNHPREEESSVKTICNYIAAYQVKNFNNNLMYNSVFDITDYKNDFYKINFYIDSMNNNIKYKIKEKITKQDYTYYMYPKLFTRNPLKSIINHPAYKLENGVLYMKNVHDKEEVFTSDNWKVITDYNELRKKE